MTKKHRWTRQQKDRVEERFHQWLGSLNLLPMHVSYDFALETPEDSDTDQHAALSIECGYPYRTVCLTVYPSIAAMDDDYLDLCLIHEAVHAVLVPMQRNRNAPWEYFRDNLELVTDHLAYYIHSAYQHAKSQDDEIQKLKRRKR